MSCKAQIAPLYKADYYLPEGTYYKDLDNDLDKFVGTWVWQDGNTSLTFVLEKKEQVHDDSSNIYEDMIIGEYQYIEDGNEIVNFLSRLQDASITGFAHYLVGVAILHKNHPPLKCSECTDDERRILLYFSDPLTPYISNIVILRHVVVNGQEKIQAALMGNGTVIVPEGGLENQRVPYGDYIFVKQ